MPRQSKLATQRFGHIVALEPTAERKNGYTVWRCICDCGRSVFYPSRYLKNGWATTCEDPECEYAKEEWSTKEKREDLTGRRFGKLVVLSPAMDETTGRRRKDSRGRILWNCRCDCGNTIVAPTGQLKAGYRRSCGCLSRPPRKDWIGKRFGMLTVISYDGKRSGKHFWNCRCDCGKETSVCQSNLKNGHTTSCGCQNTPYSARTLVDGTCVESIRGAIEKKTIARNNSSGVRGVYKSKRTGRWCAQITFQGKTRYLGSYETLKEARLAREKGEEVFEEFLEKFEADLSNKNE